jgi:RNA polymerase sigma factor (sigma-70 family)
MQTEDEWLQALRQGKEKAWDEAFRRLWPAVYAAALHPLARLTPGEAEDVAIETLTALVPKVRTISDWPGLRALAVTIAVREAISLRRKISAEKRGGGQTASLEALQEGNESFEVAAPAVAALSALELNELSKLLGAALAEVDEVTRKLLSDFLVRQMSYKEMAEKHQLPLGTIGVNLARGLKKVRAGLEQNPRLMKEIRAHLR